MIFHVHHIYSSELFWYFFHGAEIDPRNVPTWFYPNRHNKHIKIDFDVELKFKYKGIDVTAIFTRDTKWEDSSVIHIFDYNIDLIEREVIADRGWNRILDKNVAAAVDFLNSKPATCKIIFFYINWERTSKNEIFNFKKLNKNITIYLDDWNAQFTSNQRYSFTHILSSYIFPNTINLKEYYFMADYLKTYDEYECKLNFPIRRVGGNKKRIYDGLQSLNNENIRCSISSFTDYKQHESSITAQKSILNNSIKAGNNVKYIKKRGYNLEDWGGEWNGNNMKEFMWKLLSYSEVNVVFEVRDREYVSEKSISHILAGKPFLPVFKTTIEYYRKNFEKYGLDVPIFPIEYQRITDCLDILDDITRDEGSWEYVKNQLQEWVDSLRFNYIECIHNHNGMLDDILSHGELKRII